MNARGAAAIVLVSFLVGCQTDGAPTPSATASVSDVILKECAVYFAIVTRLANENIPSNGNIAEDCPGEADINADITPINPPPSMDERLASNLFRKMIARGVPSAIAADVSKSQAFADWVATARESAG